MFYIKHTSLVGLINFGFGSIICCLRGSIFLENMILFFVSILTEVHVYFQLVVRGLRKFPFKKEIK